MRAYTLFSGSSGNATYVSDGETSILIDAGKCTRAIEKALAAIGASLDELSAIFLTHEHIDHVAALKVLTKKITIPVHLTKESAEKLTPIDTYIHSEAVLHTPLFQVTIGSLIVSSVPVSHDSACCVGYRIESAHGGTVAVVTDVGFVSDALREGLSHVDAVVLESNHDEDMLLTGPYPYELKQRIRSEHGHLSNDACAALVCELAGQGTKCVTLAHVSKENNTPELAYVTTRTALDSAGYPDVELRVASPDTPTVAYPGVEAPVFLS